MKSMIAIFAILMGSYATVSPDAGTKAYMLQEVNELRAKGCYCGRTYMPPAPPVEWHDKLYRSALSHAKEMSDHGFFSHFGRYGENIGARLDEHQYRWQVAGENLGEGQKTFDEVLRDWIQSDSHCEMLMNPKVEDMAVARYRKMWVQHFGKELPPNVIPRR